MTTEEQHWRLSVCKKYGFGRSFVIPCSTIDNPGRWFVFNGLQQVSGVVLFAILGRNNLNNSASIAAASVEQHHTVCTSSLPDHKTPGSLLLAILYSPSRLFPHDRQSAVSGRVCRQQLRAEALNEALSASLWYGWTFCFSPCLHRLCSSALWRRGWWVFSP